MDALLNATGISRRYPLPPGDKSGAGHKEVLSNVDVEVRAGEMLTIVGPSGSGKSSLLYCLSGVDEISAGSVTMLGQPIHQLSPAKLADFRSRHMGFVFQAYNLIESLTAFDNVALPLKLAGKPADDAVVDQALAGVGLSEVARQRPGQLSGGQQQRVALARALATQPRILFADEPTGALDSTSGDQVLRLLREYVTPERSVVMVTHDLEAAALGDRTLVLRDGVIHSELHHPTLEEILGAVAAAKSGHGGA